MVLAGLLAGNAAVAGADELPDWNADTITGDWGGTRAELYDKGVELGFNHKSDLLANTSGGVARGGAWLMNSEFSASFDLDKLAGWQGGSAFIQYHVQHGNKSINNYSGSLAGVSNIETGSSTGQFYQAWLQQNFADDRASVLAGLYAIDSEFYVTDSSGLFLEPPYGMATDLAQTGKNGPPVFPLGALGIRLKYTGSSFYLQGALTDGVPGDPNNAQGTQIRLNKGDGTLAIAEFGYMPEDEEGTISKTAIGLWRYTAKAGDLTAVDAFGNPVQRNDRGGYILAEHTLMSEANNPGQGLAGFVRLGFVNKNVYQSDWSGSIGLIYQGLFDGRDDDTAGIGITTSHASAKYRQLNAALAYETMLELTYSAQLLPGLSIQPDLQYIRNPNMDPTLKDAWVVGARMELEL